MAEETKLLALASAELKKDKDAKALDALKESVEDNEMQWRNEIHEAKRTVTRTGKAFAAAQKNVNISGAQYLNLEREMKVAEANLESLEAAFAARF